MDPLAHTLVGGTLAELGLKDKSALAYPTLLIGANLPDIDGVAMFLGRDASLWIRRGWTHGVLAMVLLPLALAGGVKLYDDLVRKRRHPDSERVDFKALLVLSYVGVLSHPLLDLLNVYGVRLLMPFDGRWFYGDSFFIVDPWMWLLMGVSVVLAGTHSRFGTGLWSLIGALTTLLVLGVSAVPMAAKVIWVIGVATILGLRLRANEAQLRKVPWVAAALFVVYLGAMITMSKAALFEVRERVPHHHHVMVEPTPGNSLHKTGMVTTDSGAQFFEASFGLDGMDLVMGEQVAAQTPDEAQEKALRSPAVRGLVNWMRFPHYETRKTETGYRVYIRDLRFAEIDREKGFGVGVVELDADLNEVP